MKIPAHPSWTAVGLAVSVALIVVPGCGSSGGAAMGRALARAAATVAVAAVAEGATRRRRARRARRQGRVVDDAEEWSNPGLAMDAPFEVFEYEAIVGEERRPLPLDRSLAVIEIDPAAITCEVDTECAVLVAGCCSCAEGGGALAVRSDMVDELRAEVLSECEEGCPATRPEHVTCTSEPACIHGLCRLIDDRVPEPPVPEPPPG